MSVCVNSVFVMFCLLVAALRRADSPSRESYRLCKRSRNWKSGQRPTKGCRAIDRHHEIRMSRNLRGLLYFHIIMYLISICPSFLSTVMISVHYLAKFVSIIKNSEVRITKCRGDSSGHQLCQYRMKCLYLPSPDRDVSCSNDTPRYCSVLLLIASALDVKSVT
jgi:hypothetical protein